MNRLTGRQILKIAGYTGFFVVAFLLFFIATFPIERFGRMIEQQLGGALGREVVIGDADLSLTGALVLTGVEIGAPTAGKAVPTVADDQAGSAGKKKKPAKKRPRMYLVDEIVLDIGVLALAFGNLDVELDVEGLGGEIYFAFEGPLSFFDQPAPPPRRGGNKKPTDAEEEQADDVPIRLALEVEGIVLQRILDLKSVMPVPVSGTLNLFVELASPTAKFAQSTGTFSLSLQSVILSKKGFESELFGMNLAVPPIAIQSLDSEITIEKGVGQVSTFDMKSKHVDVKVQGGLTLRDPLPKSQLDLYLMFKPLPAYIEKSNILKTLMPDIDNLSKDAKKAHREDGYFGFRYTGAMDKSGRFSAAKEYTPRGSRPARASRAKRSRSKARPPRRTRAPKAKAPKPPVPTPPPSIRTTGGDDIPQPAAGREPPIREPREPLNLPSAAETRISRERAARERRIRAAEEAKEEAVEEIAEEEGEEEVEEVEEAEEVEEEVEEEAEESAEAETPEKEEAETPEKEEAVEEE